MNRGEIWWADLPVPTKSEPGFRRPVLIVQADSFNESKIRTVVCAVITSNVRLSEMPGNVFLGQRDSHLGKDSVINVPQLITIDRDFLSDCVGSIPQSILDRVDSGMRLVLDLDVST